MNALKTMGVGFVSLILILLVVGGGYNLLALNLGTVSGDYFKGMLAVVVLLGGAWLSMQNLGFIGKPFMLGAALVLLTITVRHRVPGVAEFFSQTTQAADRAADRAAVSLSAARTIPCDRTTPTLQFFERETGRPLVWLSEDGVGRLICWDRPGRHPQTNKTLVAVDERLAASIIRQEPTDAGQPPAENAVVTPAPSAVAELGEGPIPDLSEGPIPR